MSIIAPSDPVFGHSTMDPTNASYPDFDPPGIIEGRGVQAVFSALYTAILILGLFGNVLVCFVVVRNNAMHTVTNVFIMNLALSDILLCVLAVPFTPIYTFLGRWEFGSVMCHAVSYAQCCSVYISTLTLTSIALDRYFVIIYPFYPRMQMRTCVIIIMSIWLFSAAVTLPYGYYMETLVNKENGVELCEERWPSEEFRFVFGSVTASMQFLIPFIVIAFCYIRVSIRLNQRTKARPGTTNSRKEEFKRERKRRTNRMLIAMVTIFGISWLPLNLINTTNDFFIDTVKWRYYHLSFFLAHSLAMSSTCYNPFLYAWLNEHFRKEFKLLLPCFDRESGEAGRQEHWRSERTCNGNNETLQETLLPSAVHHGSSATAKATGGGGCGGQESGTAVEEEEVRLDTRVTRDANSETVTLQLIQMDGFPAKTGEPVKDQVL